LSEAIWATSRLAGLAGLSQTPRRRNPDRSATALFLRAHELLFELGALIDLWVGRQGVTVKGLRTFSWRKALA
jgi:hypothetical protein